MKQLDLLKTATMIEIFRRSCRFKKFVPCFFNESIAAHDAARWFTEDDNEPVAEQPIVPPSAGGSNERDMTMAANLPITTKYYLHQFLSCRRSALSQTHTILRIYVIQLGRQTALWVLPKFKQRACMSHSVYVSVFSKLSPCLPYLDNVNFNFNATRPERIKIKIFVYT